MSSSIVRTIDSVATSAMVEDGYRPPRRRFSLGALAEGGGNRSLSLIQTHSSRPNLRPSFEFEVARLAQLPDDDDDDGGIESTLLKLEGRFGRGPSQEREVMDGEDDDSATPTTTGPSVGQMDLYPGGHLDGGSVDPTRSSDSRAASSVVTAQGDRHHRRRSRPPPRRDDSLWTAPSGPTQAAPSVEGSAGPKEPYVHAIFAASIVDSDYSYSSTPILERGLSNKSLGGRQTRGTRSTTSLPRQPLARHQGRSAPDLKTARPKLGPSDGRMHLRPAPPPASDVARGSIAQESFLLDDDDDDDDDDDPAESFLLDDDQDLSDLSSELSIDEVERTPRQANTSSCSCPRTGSGPAISEMAVPSHPLRHSPSPPPSANRASPVKVPHPPARLDRSAPSPAPSPSEHGPGGQKARPLTANVSDLPVPSIFIVEPSGPKHLPFILEHGSELLAQQFTLIEKDALTEIDWRELVELRASPSSLDTRDWYKFLKSDQAKGVGLVIARFNIIVKWALSEVVLTPDIQERARTISKYVHIAWHARKMRNFATLYQIMTALLSVDCSRLKRTWQLVPRLDVEMVKELETLIQPVRNFHRLRVEMETATVQDGCIPFLGRSSFRLRHGGVHVVH